MIGTAIKLPEDEATPERRSEKLFNQMDTDRDDRLSLEEFTLGVKSDDMMLRVLAMNTSDPDIRLNVEGANPKDDCPPSSGPPLEPRRSVADCQALKSSSDFNLGTGSSKHLRTTPGCTRTHLFSDSNSSQR
ncbi:unnamed protein product [Echinostoma caproni]|uniref:EF-hand domain-containing protein n=1 Tax=Echinostoma caproni TaxID=27848 RepID=A0A183B487_9TREM|nr:unnamed protein product [Echinostoma caproni]